MRTIIYKVNGENLSGLNSNELDALYQKGIYVCKCKETFRFTDMDTNEVTVYNKGEHYLYSEENCGSRDKATGVLEVKRCYNVYHDYDKNEINMRKDCFDAFFVKVGLMEQPKKRKYTY